MTSTPIRFFATFSQTRLLTTFAAFAVLAVPQNAVKLEYVLSGPAIGGVTPSGKAVIDQPSLPGKLTCEVKDVNLPDGTVLEVSVSGFIAGPMTLSGRRAKMQAPIPFQVRTGPFEILNSGTTIMTGRFKI